MPYIFLFLVITLPLLEIYVLIKTGMLIGAIPTIALVVFSAVLGTLLLRWQGFVALQRLRLALVRSTLPAADLLDGMIVLISGILLLIPGFLTDIVALLCLVPAVRRRLVRRLLGDNAPASPPPRSPDPGPRVIEGEYWKERL